MASYCFFFIGLITFLFSLWRTYLSYLALSWPRVSGSIIRAYVETRNGSSGTRCRGIIEFRYEFEKRAYQDREFVRLRDVDRYAKDGQVSVCVNPSKPKQAIVQNGFDWRFLFWATVGAGFMYISFLITYQN